MRLENIIVRDEKFFFTLISYFLVLVIFINLSFLQSAVVGVLASLIYVLINATLLGHVFFESQEFFFKLILGSLLFAMLLGFAGWLVLKIYNLDVVGVTFVLFVGATISSLLNRRMRHKNA